MTVDTAMADGLLDLLEEIRSSDPASYDSVLTVLVLAAQMHLGKLGFGSGPYSGAIDLVTAEAVRKYENARGLPVTGDVLSRNALSQVLSESAVLNRAERTPAPSLKIFGADQWAAGYVLVQGTWIMEGQESPFHEVARIECFRQSMQCEIVFARLGRNDNALTIEQEAYEIDSWGTDEILSEPKIYPCARYVLFLSRPREVAMTVRETASTTGACEHMSPDPLIHRIATWEEAADRDSTRLLTAELFNLDAKARQLMQREQP